MESSCEAVKLTVGHGAKGLYFSGVVDTSGTVLHGLIVVLLPGIQKTSHHPSSIAQVDWYMIRT